MKKPTTRGKKAAAVAEAAELPVPEALESGAENPTLARRTVGVAQRRKSGTLNPLFDLPEKLQGDLFKAMRDGHRDAVILQMLREEDVTGISPLQLNDFYQQEAQERCEMRQLRAAQEAKALMNTVHKSLVPFSPATLAALDQEIFRQISRGESEPGAIAKMGTLFLKVRSNLRADEMHELRREKLKRELQGQIDHAVEKLAEEVERHPEARAAFESLRQVLADCVDETEETL